MGETEAAGELHMYLVGFFVGEQPTLVAEVDKYVKRAEAEAREEGAREEREKLRKRWSEQSPRVYQRGSWMDAFIRRVVLSEPEDLIDADVLIEQGAPLRDEPTDAP